VKRLLCNNPDADFVFCAGDDKVCFENLCQLLSLTLMRRRMRTCSVLYVSSHLAAQQSLSSNLQDRQHPYRYRYSPTGSSPPPSAPARRKRSRVGMSRFRKKLSTAWNSSPLQSKLDHHHHARGSNETSRKHEIRRYQFHLLGELRRLLDM
jgi:hypothetical protein